MFRFTTFLLPCSAAYGGGGQLVWPEGAQRWWHPPSVADLRRDTSPAPQGRRFSFSGPAPQGRRLK